MRSWPHLSQVAFALTLLVGTDAMAAPSGRLTIEATTSLQRVQTELSKYLVDTKWATVSGTHGSVADYGLRYRLKPKSLRLTTNRRGAVLLRLQVDMIPIRGARQFVRLTGVAPRGAMVEGCRSTSVSVSAPVTLGVRNARVISTVGKASVSKPWCMVKINFAGRLANLVNRNIRDYDVGAIIARQTKTAVDQALASRFADSERWTATLERLIDGATGALRRPIPVGMGDLRLDFGLATEPTLSSVVVNRGGVHVAVTANIRPALRRRDVVRAESDGERNESTSERVHLPLELVIPIMSVPEHSGPELRFNAPPLGDLGVAPIPGHPNLMRLRHLRESGARDLFLFSAPSLSDAGESDVTGSLVELLHDAAGFLGEPGNWPPGADSEAKRLSKASTRFANGISGLLRPLEQLSLVPGITLRLTKPQIALHAGRYDDNSIRVPVTLSGVATLSIAVESLR
ncbi:MAG: hypothetical protein AAF493_16840 [Pseudomonadota bacterium]